jgi:hypothetical protein
MMKGSEKSDTPQQEAVAYGAPMNADQMSTFIKCLLSELKKEWAEQEGIHAPLRVFQPDHDDLPKDQRELLALVQDANKRADLSRAASPTASASDSTGYTAQTGASR